MLSDRVGVVDFPTLGHLIDGWVTQHCRVPDGFSRGKPFVKYDWQFWCTANFYRVREDAKWVPEQPMLNQAFTYRRALVVSPQKSGKSPDAASDIAVQAVGPTVFGGWAKAGDVYDCADHGCGCGWSFDYQAGEPKGIRQPSPLIQLTATSVDQPLALDTVVPTVAGMKSVGTLAPGDEVFGSDGLPVQVARLTPVYEGLDCYRVIFDDGEEIVASAGHSWTVDSRSLHDRKQSKVTISTAEMAESFRLKAGGARYSVPLVSVEYPTTELPLDPYLLGLWLGDGSSGDATIAINTDQLEEVTGLIAAAVEPYEVLVFRQGPGRGGTIRVRRSSRLCKYGHDWSEDEHVRQTDGSVLCGPCYRREPAGCAELRLTMRERLREVGVLGNKHIPEGYLRADRAQRMALLQGLMDSDGNVATNGLATFTNANWMLIADAQRLLVSLGFKIATTGDPKRAQRIRFVPHAADPVCRLAHKVARHRGDGYRRISRSRFIRLVEHVPSVRTRCIGIDTADHLFVVGEHNTLTHNTDNVYRPLVAMIHLGPLKKLMRPRENFIRILGLSDDPDMDRIDAVTSSAMARLGNPISFAHQDESGLYTARNNMRKVAETQRRGAAGMGGRSQEHTNPWDPAENSVAQTTFESQAPDIFKFYREPPRQWSFGDKRERHRILQYVYAGSSHINIDSIEAEAVELMERDPTQAERFFGNRLVQGLGSWLPDGLWESSTRVRELV